MSRRCSVCLRVREMREFGFSLEKKRGHLHTSIPDIRQKASEAGTKGKNKGVKVLQYS